MSCHVMSCYGNAQESTGVDESQRGRQEVTKVDVSRQVFERVDERGRQECPRFGESLRMLKRKDDNRRQRLRVEDRQREWQRVDQRGQ